MKSFAIAAALTLALFTSLAAAAPPSMDDIRTTMSAKDYRGALQSISRVIDLKGDIAAPYDKIELNSMRGECFLQLKQFSQAALAYNTAVKLSPDASSDLALRSRAMAVLIKAAPLGTYTFKHRDEKSKDIPTGPISILDLEARHDAFRALLVDRLFEDTPKVKAAAAGKSIPPILDAANRIADVYAVELAATGAHEETDKLLAELGTSAVKLMGSELASTAERMKQIGVRALASHGLSSADRAELQQKETYAEDIGQASKLCGDLAKKLGKNDWAFDLLTKKSDEVAGWAKTMRTADSSGGVKR